jgi:hypothetical protein
MLYTAKCYWPGITAAEFERVASSRLAEPSAAPGAVSYLGSLLFPDDELLLCLFEGRSRAAANQVTELAGIPCERIMNSVWLPAVDETDARRRARRRPDRQPRLAGRPAADSTRDSRRFP